MNKTCLNLFILVDFVCSSHREVNFVSSEFEEQLFSDERIGVLCLLYQRQPNSQREGIGGVWTILSVKEYSLISNLNILCFS